MPRIPELLKGEYLENIARGIDCEVIRQPLGCVGIPPFNFPDQWMFPLTISSGNTFIFKPSEKVPLTAIRLVQLRGSWTSQRAINLVHGCKDCVDTLLTHPDVKAVSLSAPPPANTSTKPEPSTVNGCNRTGEPRTTLLSCQTRT